MVSRSDGVSVRVERFIESLAVSALRDETTIVFAIDRRCALKITAGKTVTLEPWDLATLPLQRPSQQAGVGEFRRVDLGVPGDAKIYEWRVASWFPYWRLTVCEHCGGAVKIIACIEDKLTVRKILAHVERATSPPSQLPPARFPGRLG
jgi:hypothetical protein